jgi:hypothetical protein
MSNMMNQLPLLDRKMTSSPNGSDDGGNNVVVHTSDTESEAIDGVEIGHRSRAQVDFFEF